VLIACAYTVSPVHVGEVAGAEQDGDGAPLGDAEVWSGELDGLDHRDHLIDAAAPLLADIGPPHDRSDGLVARTGRLVDEPQGIDQGAARIGDLHPVGEDLHGRSGAGDGEILVDQGVGNQLADGQLGVHADGRPQRRADPLGLRDLVVDVADRLLEADRVALGAGVLLERGDAIVFPVDDDAKRLAGEAPERAEVAGEEDCPDVPDVVAVAAGRLDQGFLGQAFQDGRAVVRERLIHQAEVVRVVEQGEHLVGRGIGKGDPVLEGSPGQDRPEATLDLRVIAELLVGADPDVFRVLEAHGRMRGGGDLEQDEMLAALVGLVDAEMDLGVEVDEEPVLQLLASDLLGPRAERRPDEIVSAVVDPLDEIGLGLAQQGGGVGEGGEVLPDFLGVLVILLELDPFRLLGKGGKVADARQEAVGAEAHPMTSSGRTSTARAGGEQVLPDGLSKVFVIDLALTLNEPSFLSYFNPTHQE
jgi:hypothetical protein